MTGTLKMGSQKITGLGAGTAGAPAIAFADSTTTGFFLSGTDIGVSTGVAFPATQVPSTNANTLDDYEEGTFTPALTFGGGSTGLAYTVQAGRYIKVGKQVKAAMRFTLSNKGSSTGAAVVTGLPFTAGATNPVGGGSVYYTSAVTMTGAWAANVVEDTSTCSLRQFSAAGPAALTEASFGNVSDFELQVNYEAAA
jgi:hypothetical protein